MIWFSKLIANGDFKHDFDLFEKLFVTQRAPRDMMMISTGSAAGGDLRIYAGFPLGSQLPGVFRGFELTPPDRLPKEATLLIARDDAFSKRFKDPSQI